MADRYSNRRAFTNNRFRYRSVLENRGVKQIDQFATGRFSYPSPSEMRNLNVTTHIWTTGDHYYKLANEFYGDSTYWWVIAHFNLKPTEDELNYGDAVYIPQPLDKVLQYYRLR